MLLLDKTLLRLSKGLWGWIILITLLRTAGLVMMTIFAESIASYLGNLFDPLMTASEAAAAVRTAFISSLALFALQLLQGECEYRCSAAARKKVRETIFDKIIELDAGNIEKIGPVSAVTSSVDAVENIQTYYSSYLPSLLLSFAAPLYLFLRLRNKALVQAVILLCVSVILLPMNNIFRGKIEKLRKSYWKSLDDMTSSYLDGIRGMTTLKLFERDREHAEVLSVKAETLNRNINKFMKVNFTSFLASEGLIYTAIFICVLLAVMDLSNGKTELGTAFSILLLSYSYFGAVRQLMSATHNALTAVSAAMKAEEILDTDTSRPYEPKAVSDPQGYEGIRMDHVSFGYAGREKALKDINMHIAKGKVTAFCGLSGCGKSTAASLLMRFMDPDEGRIYLEGKDYLSMKPEEVRDHIVMIPQTVTLFSGSIRDNLKIADENATEEEMMDALHRSGLSSFVHSLKDGLDSSVGENGSRLSGGQKQKMGIARALLSRCEYMIFDEATSSVDPESEQEIWKCIDELSETRTLIIISHRLSSIRNADMIYVLDHGTTAEAGNHEELMKHNGLYRKLCEEQNVMEGGAS